MPEPVIGITIGDPSGIGPEIIRKALCRAKLKGVSVRVIGNPDRGTPGKPSKRGAQAAFRALEESVALVKKGEIQAVVNAPVHKEGLMSVGFDFPGQTEFYAACFGLKPDGVTMAMLSPRMKVGLATTHCSLRQAIRLLTPARIVSAGLRLGELLGHLKIRRPRLAVCGLNPHAGEGGHFGDEEGKVILPAVRELAALLPGVEVSGPAVPDAVFRKAWEGGHDAVVCLYHDQGLIPFKLMAFEEGVNATLGLPFVRCSPDHGTAHDIAGKGKASSASMVAALEWAAKMVK